MTHIALCAIGSPAQGHLVLCACMLPSMLASCAAWGALNSYWLGEAAEAPSIQRAVHQNSGTAVPSLQQTHHLGLRRAGDPRQHQARLLALYPGQAPFSHSTASAFTNLAPLPGVPVGVPLTPPAGYAYSHAQPAAYAQPPPPGFLAPTDPRMQLQPAPAAAPAYTHPQPPPPAMQPAPAQPSHGGAGAGGVPFFASGGAPLLPNIDLRTILQNVGVQPAPDQAPAAAPLHQPHGPAPHQDPAMPAYAQPQAPQVPNLAGEELLNGGGAGAYLGFGMQANGGQPWQAAPAKRDQPGPALARAPAQQQQQHQQAGEGQEIPSLQDYLAKIVS